MISINLCKSYRAKIILYTNMNKISFFTCENIIDNTSFDYIKNKNLDFNSYYYFNHNKRCVDQVESAIQNIVNFYTIQNNILLDDNYSIEFKIIHNPSDNTIYPTFKPSKYFLSGGGSTSISHNDGEDRVYPIFSSILFLTNHQIPFLMTNINSEEYMYKKFNIQQNLKVVFPNKNTSVIFDPQFCNGFAIPTMSENTSMYNNPFFAIEIHIWDKPLFMKNEYIPISTTNNMSAVSETKHKIDISNKTLDFKPITKQSVCLSQLFTYHTFNQLLYSKKYKSDLIEPIYKLYDINNCPQLFSITKHVEVVHDNIDYSLYNIIVKHPVIPNNNIQAKFFQRFLYKQFINKNACVSLVDFFASNTQHWKINKNDTSLPMNFIDLNHFCENNHTINNILQHICDEINSSYNLNDNKIVITHFLYTKYDKDNLNEFLFHADDKRNIIAEVVLNKHELSINKEDEPDYIVFDDDISISLSIGDLLLYSNAFKRKVPHIYDNYNLYKLIVICKI